MTAFKRTAGHARMQKHDFIDFSCALLSPRLISF